MDIVDRDMERAEVEATRTWSQSSKERRERESLERRQKGLERQNTGGETSSVSSGSSTDSDEQDMGRIRTASAATMGGGTTGTRTRTHPIEQHRTQTHKLQHTQTVGASMRTKTESMPLPEFGGGKPYPPPLPAREEYVVEFDGKDDPLHPQNWPTKRK